MGRGRTLAEFQKKFPDEASCAGFLFARRWPDGFVCPACGRGRALAFKSRMLSRSRPVVCSTATATSLRAQQRAGLT